MNTSSSRQPSSHTGVPSGRMGQGEAPPAGGVLGPAASQAPLARNGVKWHLTEVRIEGSGVSAVGFSEPCNVCGRKKRRALQPPTRERKKVLVIEQEEVCGDDSPGGRSDIRGHAIEDDDPEPSFAGKEDAGVPASTPSAKEVVDAPPLTPAEMEKDKKADTAAKKPKKADMAATPGRTKKPEASTRDECVSSFQGTEVTVRVNGTGGVVFSGGKLVQVKLSETCKCEALYEIVF